MGIDLGAGSIKVVWLKCCEEQVQLLGWDCVPTPQGSINDGMIVEPAMVGRALRELLNKSRYRANFAGAAVPGHLGLLRQLDVPVMTPAETKKAIRLHLEYNIPLRPEEMAVSFKTCRTEGKNGKTSSRLLITVTRRMVIQQLMEAFAHARIKVQTIEYAPLALGRHLTVMNPEDNGRRPENCLIMDWGAGGMVQLSYFMQRELCLFRSFLYTGGVIPTFRELSEEIWRSVNYIQQQHPGFRLDNISVMGGNGPSDIWLSELADWLELPVNWFCWPVEPIPTSPDFYRRYALAWGLARPWRK